IAPEYDGIVLYAKDAMEGLALANQLQQNEIEYTKTKKQETETEKTTPTAIAAKSNVSTDVPVFVPTDLERHILKDISLSHIIPYVNWQMVLGHHLGLKGKVKRLLEEKDEKALMLKQVVDDLLDEAQRNNWITPAAVYQFFPAQSEGNRIYIYSPKDKRTIIEMFEFPRQPREPYLCLADHLKSTESGQIDYVGFFAVTAGKGIRELSQRWKESGEFLKSHAIQALALEIAEGLAELIHQVMRDRWGFPDDPDFTMEQRFAAKYQGQRYSFGYPACPNLEDQEKLFRLLNPEEIGIHLTDGYMMEPEASVSAIVFAHPEARYFNVL
ncbi:methionine synthase, partial [Parageobacillus sp. SY1]